MSPSFSSVAWVSSRAPVWGASAAGRNGRAVAVVSSRAPVWGASLRTERLCDHRKVSSRAPVWGASAVRSGRVACAIPFQVVPPCGGHPSLWSAGSRTSSQFQVVPPCGGHRADGDGLPVVVVVSSRAPVWGASVGDHGRHRQQRVSSRAPVWGASLEPVFSRRFIRVSSRAPVWGASILIISTSLSRI